MKNIKCRSCFFYRNEWCEKIVDSPDPEEVRDCAYFREMTNADRIRSMTDEELAWELMLWRCEAVARNHGISSEYPDTQQTILEWLQQPAEEDDMTDCKHEFVYDELHGEIVCKFCGYVLTADDKRELHRKAFELMEEEEGAD